MGRSKMSLRQMERKPQMTAILVFCMLIGILEGLKTIQLTRQGYIPGVISSKTTLEYLLK